MHGESCDSPYIFYTQHELILAVNIQIVREVEVLKAAKSESRTVLLVYASEKALNVAHSILSSQLRVFLPSQLSDTNTYE